MLSGQRGSRSELAPQQLSLGLHQVELGGWPSPGTAQPFERRQRGLAIAALEMRLRQHSQQLGIAGRILQRGDQCDARVVKAVFGQRLFGGRTLLGRALAARRQRQSHRQRENRSAMCHAPAHRSLSPRVSLAFIAA